ncbi:hypothetical protein [Rhodanobacter aciditrophus]|uniref:hypothetical protein n=1 Tax=Rhodanobacter aciditrophus TaxID=1623218 RepID=UPI003CEDE07F
MLKTTMLSLAAVFGLGIGTLVAAQTAQPAPDAMQKATARPAARQHQVIKPGDRNCIRDTGSLIPAKKGQCLQGAFGRSYSARELRSTGQQDIAGALRMLDPAVH